MKEVGMKKTAFCRKKVDFYFYIPVFGTNIARRKKTLRPHA
jgi:hypothetical protein